MRNAKSSAIFAVIFCRFVLGATLVDVHAGAPPPCSIVVDNTNDSGSGSLREAIVCAAPGDTITFTLSLPATITLTTGQLVINKNLTILGPGANQLAINGGFPATTNRVFDVTNSVTVTIVGLTVTNGYVGNEFPSFLDQSGGGIRNQGSTLTVSNCAITGNSAAGNDGVGGGIFNPGGVLTVVNSTISHNDSHDEGGGIFNLGTLIITNSTVASNHSGSSGGGGIYNFQTLTVINSTLNGNSATEVGGGIFNDGSIGNPTATIVNSAVSGNSAAAGGGIHNLDATLIVSNSTLSGNSASAGGGINNVGNNSPATLTVINSTISSNSPASSGGGLENITHGSSATVTLLNSTLSENSVTNDGSGAMLVVGSTIFNASPIADVGTFVSLGYNLSSDAGGGVLTNAADQINTNPLLGSLRNNGGPTLTHAPLCGSPAIDKGTNFTGSATDQRGAPRTFDTAGIDNAAGGDGTDIGAVESPILLFTVSNLNDIGPGSLRFAINTANDTPGADLIEFEPGVTGTLTLNSGELLIIDCLTILGPGATNVAVNGNAASRVFNVGPGITVTIAGLTITNGVGDPKGGGIYNDGSSLTVSNCTVTRNFGPLGGGINNDSLNGPATLTVVNCTISSNSASGAGGGLRNDGEPSETTVTIANSTFSGNSSSFGGGGIFSRGASGGSATISIFNSTFSGNLGGSGPGSILTVASGGGSATTRIGSTILDAGATDTNLAVSGGTITSDGFNLSSDNGGGFLTQPTDLTNTNAMLGPLQLNGGQTPTHALLCGSPAIDAGTNFLALATDQRGAGFPRTFDDPSVANVGDGTDIGAFEHQTNCNQPPVALCSNITVSANSSCEADASIDAGSYDPEDGSSVTLSQSPVGPYSLGAHGVTLTVTDTQGATNSCSAVVNVVDDTPPTITCPANIITNAAAGACNAVVAFAPIVNDNCPGVTTNCVPPSGSSFPVGTTNVVCTATDGSGNSTQCTFTVTVRACANLNYSGDTSVFTAGPKASSAPVRLSADVLPSASCSGSSVTNARVCFYLFKSSNLGNTPDVTICNVPVNSSSNATALASLGVDTWTVKVKIDPNNLYWHECDVEMAVVNVALGTTDKRTAGGVWVPDAKARTGKLNAGWTVDYQKNGNPKGQWVSVLKAMDGYNYQFKSTSWQGGGLTFFSDPTKAAFSGKCVIQKIDPATGNVVDSLGAGNCTFTADVVDGDLVKPSQPDKYGIRILLSPGQAAFWNNAATAATIYPPVTPGGGNVSVKSK